MDFQETLKILESASEKIRNFDIGDLMSMMEIASLYNDIEKRITDNPALKDVLKFVKLQREFFGKISETNLDKEINNILYILNRGNLSLIELFSKQKSGQDVATTINSLVKEMASVVAEIDKRNSESPAESEAPPTGEKKMEYSDSYFSAITDDKKMLSQLYDEAKEHLDNAQYTLLELEYDDSNQENINKVFRSFHTIKGSSAFLGLKNIEDVGHQMENLLVLIRDGKLRITKKLIDVIFHGIELLRQLISVMAANDYDVPRMVDTYKRVDIFSYIQVIQKILAEYQTKKIGEILEEEGRLNKNDIALILSKQSKSDKKFGEIAVEENLVTQEDVREAVLKQTVSTKKSTYVKVSNDRLNTLVDIVGELVINQSMLKQLITNKDNHSAESADRMIAQLESITTNIKNIVLSMGMVPISEIFNKLRVVIRNTSQELSKSIVVEVTGDDTELDRNVIESIYDPLVHMVRNAVDHGIEKPDAREAKGKERVGKLLIAAEHKGNGIEITVEDDGKGIDKDVIVKKALERELIHEDDLEKMSDKDIYGLLFLAGFSTAERVTEISGRGVGLDVVKKNIDEIHGRVEIQSKKGEFTRFIIRLPLTLAIIEGFVTEVGDNKYVIPFSAVEEIIVPQKETVNVLDDGGIMLFNRGNYIPVVFAGNVFKETTYNKDIFGVLVIIIAYEGKNYGIAIDKVIGKQEIVVKNLGDVLNNLMVFSGGTIFGDGTIGFVVDIEAFLELAKKDL